MVSLTYFFTLYVFVGWVVLNFLSSRVPSNQELCQKWTFPQG
jgi:hypothetical protein